MAALILGLFSTALIALSLYFPTKIGSTVPNCRKLCIRLVVGTARISTLEKQNVDCMTEKLNILNRSRVAVMLLLLQTTSRQLVTNSIELCFLTCVSLSCPSPQFACHFLSSCDGQRKSIYDKVEINPTYCTLYKL